jgi:aspartate/methionine/tyrosine aminotransferase
VANDVWVLADEIYQRLTYFTDVAPSIAAVTPRFDNWVLINGVAKTYSMTGWRVGWMVGPADIIEAANSHQSHATGNVNNVAQHAALAALRGPQETVQEMRQAFDSRRKLMFEMVSDMPGVRCVEPQGAFYVFPDVTGAMKGRWESTDELATVILEEAGVALVAGESFGAPGHLRLSYATGEAEIERGLDRIRLVLED